MPPQSWGGFWPAAFHGLVKHSRGSLWQQLMTRSTSSNAVPVDHQTQIDVAETLEVGHDAKPVARSGTGARSWRPARQWTKQEDEILAEQRRQGVSMKGIHRTHLPHRSLRSLFERSSLFNERPKKVLSTSWTSADKDRVMSLYNGGMAAEEIAKHIPNKSWRGVQRVIFRHRYHQPGDEHDRADTRRIRATRLSPPTNQQLEVIRLLCESGRTTPEIAKATKLADTSVRRACQKLGLAIVKTSKANQTPWSANEIACLEAFLQKELSVEKAIELFPSRSQQAVTLKLSRLRAAANAKLYARIARGRTKWTFEEDELVRQHMIQKHQSIADMARKLDKSEAAVENRIHLLRHDLIPTRRGGNVKIASEGFKSRSESNK